MKWVSSFLVWMVFLVVFLFCGFANAQGCGQTVNEEFLVPCCGGLYEQPDVNCQPGGPPGNLCVEGYGECCNVSYGTANAGPSPECAPPPTCCNGGVNCGYREFCVDDCTCQRHLR